MKYGLLSNHSHLIWPISIQNATQDWNGWLILMVLVMSLLQDHMTLRKCYDSRQQELWSLNFGSRKVQGYFTRIPPEVFLGKDVVKICSKFKGERLCRSAISIKLLCNFIEIALEHGCSPVNLLHIFRTTFPKNTSNGLDDYQILAVGRIAVTNEVPTNLNNV